MSAGVLKKARIEAWHYDTSEQAANHKIDDAVGHSIVEDGVLVFSSGMTSAYAYIQSQTIVEADYGNKGTVEKDNEYQDPQM